MACLKDGALFDRCPALVWQLESTPEPTVSAAAQPQVTSARREHIPRIKPWLRCERTPRIKPRTRRNRWEGVSIAGIIASVGSGRKCGAVTQLGAANGVALPHGRTGGAAVARRRLLSPSNMRTAAFMLLVVAALGACTTRTTVHGSYNEVWDRTQHAVSAARHKAANTGAMHQRVEKDACAGTLKYVWTDGDFTDAKILTLRISPTAGESGVSDAVTERRVTIEAWSWGFFGFVQTPDGGTAELVRLSIEKEFSHPRDPNRTYEPIMPLAPAPVANGAAPAAPTSTSADAPMPAPISAPPPTDGGA